MDKESLWKLYLLRNPAFGKDGQVTMTTAGLRKLFDTTFDQGVEHGRKLDQESQDFGSMFRSMFK